MNADGSHDPESIPTMVRAINMGYDVAIASRFLPESKWVGVSTLRRKLVNLENLVLRTIFPTEDVHDFSSGFCAYRSSALLVLQQVFGNDFVKDESTASRVELLLNLRALRARVTEVPSIHGLGHPAHGFMRMIFPTVRKHWRIVKRNYFSLPEGLAPMRRLRRAF